MISILIQGWLKYPHSYCIVNVYQILSLVKNNDVKLYFQEVEPYKEDWVAYDDLTDILVTKKEQEILDSITRYDKDKNIHIDVVYRISYPYNISSFTNNDLKFMEKTPVIMFYTSEYETFKEDFYTDHDKSSCKEFITKCFSRDILPITPSNWSANALKQFKYDPLVIPHGVDTSKYYPLQDKNSFRENLSIPKNAFVFLNIGAMTGNKNVVGMIKSFYRLSLIQSNVYLVLKGIGNLYNCKNFINTAVKDLIRTESISKSKWKNVKKNLVYIDDMFSFQDMNKLYNMADCYLSPYLAEGFNLPVLEAVACGIPVIVSKDGSTEDFCKDTFTKWPKTVKVSTTNNEKLLIVDTMSLYDIMMEMISDHEFRKIARIKGPIHVEENYTWDIISEKIVNFCNYLLHYSEDSCQKVKPTDYYHQYHKKHF